MLKAWEWDNETVCHSGLTPESPDLKQLLLPMSQENTIEASHRPYR